MASWTNVSRFVWSCASQTEAAKVRWIAHWFDENDSATMSTSEGVALFDIGMRYEQSSFAHTWTLTPEAATWNARRPLKVWIGPRIEWALGKIASRITQEPIAPGNKSSRLRCRYNLPSTSRSFHHCSLSLPRQAQRQTQGRSANDMGRAG